MLMKVPKITRNDWEGLGIFALGAILAWLDPPASSVIVYVSLMAGIAHSFKGNEANG
jgi:hypothetical protein